jgi:predicted GIY-YIG superfamily endonuclease
MNTDSTGSPAGPAASPWWIYIVRCADDTLYTGIARDCHARLAEHNAGLGARYTRSRRPVELVYLEPAGSRSAAQQREHAIKALSRTGKLLLIDDGPAPVV